MSESLGLKPRHFKPWRRWAVDIDYADKLPADAKAWLQKFNREYYDGDFRGEEALHSTTEQRRACYSAQNAAYRDVMSRGAVRLEEADWLERRQNSSIRPEAAAWVTEPPHPQMSFPF